MAGKDQGFPINKFAGVNRRDGADLVGNNEFYTLQNWYQKTKGLLYKRSGTTTDTLSSSIPLAAKIAAFHRQYGLLGDLYTLLYCEPDGTTFPTPGAAPVLADLGIVANQASGDYANADLFAGGAIAALTYKYSWVGCGMESAVSPGATITVGNVASVVRITVPAFPTGVTSANVYRGNIFVGVIRASGGNTQDWAAAYDLTAVATPRIKIYANGSGNLKKGVYYITVGWFNDTSLDSRVSWATPASPYAASGGAASIINQYIQVNVDQDGGSIIVEAIGALGFVRYFIGLKPPGLALDTDADSGDDVDTFQSGTLGPLLYVGTRRAHVGAAAIGDSETITITDMPGATNVMTIPVVASATPIQRRSIFFAIPPAATPARCAFLIKKDSNGVLTECPWPCSTGNNSPYRDIDPFTGAAVAASSSGLNRGSQVQTSGKPVFANFLGLGFIANGKNLLLQCDGFSTFEIVEYGGTTQPGYPVDIIAFKDQLICTVDTGANQLPQNRVTVRNQIFGSNSLDPTNWSDTGTGTALKFVTLGDPFSDGVLALGLFSFTSATTGAASYYLGFKRASSYLGTNIPSSVGSVNAVLNQISGKVGCVAFRTVVPTPVGTLFLAQDGDIYLVNSTSGEPRRIGTKVQPLLGHLIGNDTLMALCTASYHDNHYKLSYPSASGSTGNDAQLWCDLRTETPVAYVAGMPFAWSGPHTGVNVSHQIVYDGAGDSGARIALQADGLRLLKLDDTSTFQDLGVTVVSKMSWKTSRFGSGMNKKRFLAMFFDLYYDSGFNHSILVEGFAEDKYGSNNKTLSSGGGTWNASNWNSANWGDALFFPVNAFFAPTNLIGRTFTWNLTHSNNAQIILAEAGIFFELEKRRVLP